MLNNHLEMLADPVRREVLLALANQPAEQIVVPDDVYDDSRVEETLHTEMYHTHLPKLEQADCIQWEQTDDQVGKGPQFSEIQPLISLMDEHADELPHDWP